MDLTKNNEPLVEVIILTHNGKSNLIKCLSSLKKTRYSNLIVSVVDQNSQDGTFEYIKNNHSYVKLVRNKINKSFSEGNNDILKKSKAKYCILLNDDTEHHPNWIKELVKIAEKDEKIVALQPKVLDMKNRKYFEYAGAAGGFIDIYGYPICRGRIFDSVEEDKGQYNDEKEIFWSCGVAMFIRKDMIKKINYLDEVFESYAEELDACWRMNLLGYKIFFVPNSIIYHLGSSSWGKKKNNFKKQYLIHRNHWIALLKNTQIERWWKIVPIKLLLELLTIFSFSFRDPNKSLATLKANFWILFNIVMIIKKNRENIKNRAIDDKDIIKKMIKTSVALHYFLGRKRKKFGDYKNYIENYN